MGPGVVAEAAQEQVAVVVADQPEGDLAAAPGRPDDIRGVGVEGGKALDRAFCLVLEDHRRGLDPDLWPGAIAVVGDLDQGGEGQVMGGDLDRIAEEDVPCPAGLDAVPELVLARGQGQRQLPDRKG